MVELGGAVVGEAASALAVDERGDAVDVGLVEVVEAGAAWEPPAPGAVLVLNLAALPGRVRVAEPHVDAPRRGDRLPVGPLCALVEGDRPQQPVGDPVQAFGEPGERRVCVLAAGHGDRERVAADTLGEGE